MIVRYAVVKRILIKSMMKVETRGDGAVGPRARSLLVDESLAPRKPRAAGLYLTHGAPERRCDRRRRKLRTRDTRRFEHALLLRGQPLKVTLDHLEDVAWRFNLTRVERRTLLD